MERLRIMIGAACLVMLAGCVDAGEREFNAVDIAKQAVREHAMFSGRSPDCFTYTPRRNGLAGDMVELQLRELHDRHCGGDPQTAPRAATLRIHKITGRAYYQDDATGEFVPVFP